MKRVRRLQTKGKKNKKKKRFAILPASSGSGLVAEQLRCFHSADDPPPASEVSSTFVTYIETLFKCQCIRNNLPRCLSFSSKSNVTHAIDSARIMDDDDTAWNGKETGICLFILGVLYWKHLRNRRQSHNLHRKSYTLMTPIYLSFKCISIAVIRALSPLIDECRPYPVWKTIVH